VRYHWIDRHREAFAVRTMCRVLEVSHSGYYDWRRQPATDHPVLRGRRVLRQDKLARQIEAARDSRGVYGSPRLTMELRDNGVRVSEKTVARCMRARGIRAATTAARRFVPRTTDSNHPYPIAANLLDRDFAAAAPNQKWVCDMTCIRTDEGWVYLAGVMDLYSRKIVGWSMADHMRTDLIDDALTMAITRRKPRAGLLHHSDRGCQYASGAYRRLLDAHGIVVSMSRRGNCYDNAAKESFFGTLKRECVYLTHFHTRAEAYAELFNYIEVFYNRQRRHSSIGYVSPETFEAALN
jgi:transposase InsO family protein